MNIEGLYLLIAFIAVTLTLRISSEIREIKSFRKEKELAWFILANLIFEKENFKEINVKIENAKRNLFKHNQNEYVSSIIKEFYRKDAAKWMDVFNDKRKNKSKKYSLHFNYEAMEHYFFGFFWENEVVASELTELEFLINKIVSVQPERINELNGMVKTMKMKNIFKKQTNTGFKNNN
jgi:hypothetical protein